MQTLEAPFIQPPNPLLQVQLPAVSTYPREAEGNPPPVTDSRTDRLHFMPLLSQYCTFLPIGAVSQILRAFLVFVA